MRLEKNLRVLPEGSVRTYHSLQAAADDCADSRILNGYHFRFATEEGKRQGEAIARFIHGRFLRPLSAAAGRRGGK